MYIVLFANNHRMNNKIWLYLLVLVSILLVGWLLYKKNMIPRTSEGFTQSQPFILKSGNGIYDDFYTQIYDKINKPDTRVPSELKTIIDATQADYDHSVFLDIGSGTGKVVNELTELGYDAYGVDKSNAMIAYSEKKYPNAIVKCADAMDPMCFDKGVFSHIVCLYHTIYHFENKAALFRNCFFWLKPGGFLVLHLVDRKKFDVTPPAGKDPVFGPTVGKDPVFGPTVGKDPVFGHPQTYIEEHTKDALVKFNDFKYKVSYKMNPSTSNVLVTETFTDAHTRNVRQNEHTLYMEDMRDIINEVSYNGFIPHSKINMGALNGDENQYLYIFERSL